MHSSCVRKHGHISHGSWFRKPEHTHISPNDTIKRWPSLIHISCYESISDKSMRYNLNLSTCNNNKNNVLLFLFSDSYSFLYYFQRTSIFLLFSLMHSPTPLAACFVQLLSNASKLSPLCPQFPKCNYHNSRFFFHLATTQTYNNAIISDKPRYKLI